MTLRVLYCIVSLVADEAANNFIIKSCAGMAELADAQASGACGSNIVRVQVPLPALFFLSLCRFILSHFYVLFNFHFLIFILSFSFPQS